VETENKSTEDIRTFLASLLFKKNDVFKIKQFFIHFMYPDFGTGETLAETSTIRAVFEVIV